MALEPQDRAGDLGSSGLDVDIVPIHRARLADADACRREECDEVDQISFNGGVVVGQEGSKLLKLLEGQ